MKIIIVGCGKVGQTLAEELNKEDNDITIIDTKYNLVQEIASKFDVMGVVGNGSSYKIQMEAGIEKADVLIAVTGSDELNLLCCLIAKRAGNCQTIARVRNPEYNEEVSFIKETLGLAMIINPEYTAASEIARVLRFPSAIKVDTFAKGRIELLKFKMPEGSILDGMLVMDIVPKLGCDILVCAVERGEEVFIPKGNFRLQAKDVISIVAGPKKASEFFKKIHIDTHQVKDTMIVGGGAIAYYLTQILLHMGISVKIVEKEIDRCEILTTLLPKAQIINGDASEQNLLLEEGLEQAEAFVALTNLDEENIMLSLYAKSKSDAKVATKINRTAYNQVIKELDLDTTVYPKNVTAQYIIQFVRAMKNSIGCNVESMCRIIEDKAEALEFVVKPNSELVGIPLERLAIKENALVACIVRNRKAITPRGHDSMQVGDFVVVVTSTIGVKDISDVISVYDD